MGTSSCPPPPDPPHPSSTLASSTATASIPRTTAATSRPYITAPLPIPTTAPLLQTRLPHQHPHQHHHPALYYTPHTVTRVSKPPHQDPPPHPHPIPYPLPSSARGYIPKPIRPQLPDQTLTLANAGAVGFPPRTAVAFAHQIRPFGFSPTSDPQFHPPHFMRAPQFNYPRPASAAAAPAAPPGALKGIPITASLKAAPSSIHDIVVYKDSRQHFMERDPIATIRDRKVRISEKASLYALCRSWLRNGSPEQSQAQLGNGMKCLPKPLPMSLVDAQLPRKRKHAEEEVEEERDEYNGGEDEESMEDVSAEDLLQRHVRRAKRIRARLREERLRRVARYKTRLAGLLHPQLEPK